MVSVASIGTDFCAVFSDLFRGVKSGNKQFCQDISEWVFQESMVLRIDSSTHHRVNETETPEKYTTSDTVVR